MEQPKQKLHLTNQNQLFYISKNSSESKFKGNGWRKNNGFYILNEPFHYTCNSTNMYLSKELNSIDVHVFDGRISHSQLKK